MELLNSNIWWFVLIFFSGPNFFDKAIYYKVRMGICSWEKVLGWLEARGGGLTFFFMVINAFYYLKWIHASMAVPYHSHWK